LNRRKKTLSYIDRERKDGRRECGGDVGKLEERRFKECEMRNQNKDKKLGEHSW